MWFEPHRAPMPHTEGARLDRPALEQLYIELERPIFNVVYRWLWNAEEAEDVTQETFLRIWRARERVDPSTVAPLLYKTALNLAANRRRSRRVWRWLGLDEESEASPAPTGSDSLEVEERRRKVRAAIEALPEKLRRVLVLAELSELSYGEIAKILRIPIGTVGSRRNLAIRRLAESLGSLEGFSP
jgi:RNA polymerase sigma factor (sigma-70 family)